MATRTPLEKDRLEAFAERLRRARVEAGCVSMNAGARQCNTASSVYQRHETGQLMPTVELILRYAEGFGVDPCWLTFGKEPGPVAQPRSKHILRRKYPWQSKYV
jgi:transcriptional regulator with XRE-family HTH domain